MNILLIIAMFLAGILTVLGFQVLQQQNDDSGTITAPVTEQVVFDVMESPERIADEESIKEIIYSGATVDMRNQGMTTVPMSVFEKRNTVTLILAGNALSDSFPAEVRHLQSLKVLDLSNNNFTGVPAEIGQLQKLEVLNLSGNPITGLPLELGNLKNLKVLDLRGTDYSQYDLDIISKSLSDDLEIKIK